MRSWTVGRLAARMGVTVRTLHHYDAIGLLSPSARSDAGYRLYSEADAMQLSRVLLLRRLGLSLDEIRAQLSSASNDALDALLGRHIERLRDELAERELMLERLERIREHVQHLDDPHVTLDHVMEAVEMVEKYYTKEQLEALAERRAEMGEEAMEDAAAQWSELFEGYRAAMKAGEPAGSPDNLERASRARALIEAFTGGAPEIESSLNTMYQQEGGPNVLSANGYDMDPELWAYMGAARAALDASEE